MKNKSPTSHSDLKATFLAWFIAVATVLVSVYGGFYISCKAAKAQMTDDAAVAVDKDGVETGSLDADPFVRDDSVQMMDLPVVRIRILNKITATTRTYNIDVNKPVKFDSLNIQPRSCRKAPPIAQPESAAFLEIWEKPPKKEEPEWIFSGWMFASSPGLSAMDHPVYDVWVLDCLSEKAAKTTADDMDENAPEATGDEKSDDEGTASEETPELETAE